MTLQLVSGFYGFGSQSIAVHFVYIHLNRNDKSSEVNNASNHYPKKYLWRGVLQLKYKNAYYTFAIYYIIRK